jgi:NAD(P)-dependent dehydrogenase (short-subunit alcohol dehydrogenase family)
MSRDFENKVALLAGAGPGTGAAIAVGLVRGGAKIVLAARREESTAPLAESIRAMGGEVTVVLGDTTVPADRARMIAAAVETYGGLDILVNNAFSTGRVGPIEGTDIAKAWKAAFEVNVIATMSLAEAALAPMKARGGGSIVMIGTLASRKRQPGLAGYGASKAALLAATQSLALEVGRHGVRVNTVIPSHIDGPNLAMGIAMQAKARNVDAQVIRDEIVAEGVLDHITTPEEVAEAVLFFASARASAITGQALDVNCGQWCA